MQLLIQGHSQVSTVFSKGFSYSIHCGSGTYLLCFEKWNYHEVYVWWMRNRIFPCVALEKNSNAVREILGVTIEASDTGGLFREC